MRVDQAEYPEDYDSSLQQGNLGYIEPDWREQDRLQVLNRYGFSTRQEVNQELDSL